ncbi:MAG: sensor histidine kinase, partial [Campylobacteraceae bacterium]|nr:sensor histidine kinase [Campylobacteraceae bacterium]
IDNNLSNAIKYSYENKDIYIRLTETNLEYTFIVSSHSNKILDQEKIFEEYYREEKTKEGFGLGLNLVKRICEEEDVEITLESNENITSFIYKFKKGNNL